MKLSEEQFNTLKNKGLIVPRDNMGNLFNLIVGKEYTIENEKTGEKIKAINTQNTPCALQF